MSKFPNLNLNSLKSSHKYGSSFFFPMKEEIPKLFPYPVDQVYN